MSDLATTGTMLTQLCNLFMNSTSSGFRLEGGAGGEERGRESERAGKTGRGEEAEGDECEGGGEQRKDRRNRKWS